MKNSMLKKQLKKELEANTPSDFSAVWEKCEKTQPIAQEELVAIKQTAEGVSERGQKLGKPVLALLLSVLLFCSFLLLSFFGGDLFNTPLRFQSGYFLFDVNPSVEVSYNEDGEVTAAKGLNEDGKALLVGVSLVGKRYDEAADLLFDQCVKMGYFAADRENNALLTTAVAENGEKDSTMTSALKNSFVSEFAENKIRGVVVTGVSDPQLSAEAEKYGIDAQKYGLILSYLALGGTLAEEEYATISIRELYALLEEQEQEIKRIKTEESKEILKNFEQELRETLSEQIDVLLSTLDVYMPLSDGESEDGKFDKLKEYADGLESATGRFERKKLINQIIAELDRLKESEADGMIVELIESAKITISVTYDFFENAFYRLKKISATPEEISEIRLYKFATYGTDRKDYDFEAWQKERETAFAESWYQAKESWKKERQKDF